MGQILKGDTFNNGEQVTGSRLNQLVDSATLLVGSISEQVSMTANTLEATDSILVNDSGSLKKATVGDVLNSNLGITTSSVTGGAGVDIVITPAATKKVDVDGAFEADSENIIGNSTIGGNLSVTGTTTITGNLTANGTTKANLTTDSTVVTQTTGDNSTKPASTAFVQAQVAASNYIKAFCKNSGTTINNGFNIASVTNPSVGQYIYTFTNPLPDANYVVNATAICTVNSQFCYVVSQSTSSFRVDTGFPVSYGGAFVLANTASMMVSVLKL